MANMTKNAKLLLGMVAPEELRPVVSSLARYGTSRQGGAL